MVGEPDTYIVICFEEHDDLVLATRQVFATKEKAEAYLRFVAPSRRPTIVAGQWRSLRLPAE